ncbi:hypothetical protein INP83_10470 [Mucilaginibacter sp. 21P]|uniref:hypothetical protein n=1 Tax=Mucilaginibacter sp. 21P TaxID=2778902 RepID=UPI001C59E3AA|nr:hypothetical protein [Mucilaginibacter sp. 21P]QXV67480.1 hypothetical protein INP83_10470 [Mucilaginibacter sp. 21P]
MLENTFKQDDPYQVYLKIIIDGAFVDYQPILRNVKLSDNSNIPLFPAQCHANYLIQG